jgi:hypothetical protein
MVIDSAEELLVLDVVMKYRLNDVYDAFFNRKWYSQPD